MRKIVHVLMEKFDITPVVGVEVGVETGNNAVELLWLNMLRLYLVDIWKPFIQEGKQIWSDKICEDNYQYVCSRFSERQNIMIMRSTSFDAAKTFPDSSLDFVYIDACHQYESVLEDITIWSRKVKEGGILSGHDYCTQYWPGVIRAVDEFASNHNHQVQHGTSDGDQSPDWWIV